MQTCFVVMVGAPWEHHAVFSPREVHFGDDAEDRANAAVIRLRADPEFTGFVFDAVEVVMVAPCPDNCMGDDCHCQSCGESMVDLNDDGNCAECVGDGLWMLDEET